MKVFYTDQFVLPLPEGHTFPMAKYHLLRQRVELSGLLQSQETAVPHSASNVELMLAHDADYVEKMTSGQVAEAEMKRVGFPWSAWLVERSRRSSGATTEGAFGALEDGISINLAGGTHHAFRDHGEGYCLFNDSVVAARSIQASGKVARVVVIDTDVHQGNGTAAICRLDPTIFTFSIHGAKNYPIRKEISDLDIELPDGTGDAAYLELLQGGLTEAINRSKPQLAIWVAGADPYEKDRLGRMKLTKTGLGERDRLVLEACRKAGIPVVVTMAGGYATDVNDTVDIHWATVERCILEARR